MMSFAPSSVVSLQVLRVYMMRVFFIGHRRYVKDGHWIRNAGFLIGKR